MIYFDNSATTFPSPPVTEAVARAMREIPGNPSSVHRLGQAARAALSEAKSDICRALGDRSADPGRIVFCSGGTEANDLAVLGTAYAKQRNRGKRLITTDSEHPSVLRCFEKLGAEGFDIVYLSTKRGIIDMEEFKAALTSDTVLLSVMQVNNETGAVYPVEEMFAEAKDRVPDIVTHTDATQGFLKVPLSVCRARADLVTVSAHKLNGPKGIGALYVSPDIIKGKKLSPVLFGGGQENGLRSGTENVYGAVGFAEAVKHIPDTGHITEVRDRIIGGLMPEVRHNRPQGGYAPHIINITLPGIKSQTALNYLDSKGVCVSSGSACSSNASHRNVSHVLKAFGLTDTDADCSLRISLCSENTVREADEFLSVLKDAIERLVRIK